MKQAAVNNGNRSSNPRESNGRITRARAKALGSTGGLPSLYPLRKLDDKRVLRANSKRAASDNSKPAATLAACPEHKKRAVLNDITNVTCEKLHLNCKNSTRGQHSNLDRKCSIPKKRKVAPACFAKQSQVPVDKGIDEMEEMKKAKGEESKEIGSAATIEPSEFLSSKISAAADYAEDHKFCKKHENLEDRGIVDIDAQRQDPKMCSLYAADIYSSLHATQLDLRPSVDYMEKLQPEITQGMRGILVDWLVEVSEEYRLVPDTLYLTVNLIDRFLSENFIEKPKLQLLGVTCMLIASKYEEVCAPRVEEFCFITDNTYTKEEVVKMESRVLNLLGFKLSVPTTKKFLRRFIQAAQVTYKAPPVELEFLANYLAELTLTEYSFLKFLPSLIAASAVFLARWTLDQSDHPWHPTLEHYTGYKALELKNAVLELKDLQLNTNGCMLNAIHEKYKQSKFKGVSTLRSSKPVESLF